LRKKEENNKKGSYRNRKKWKKPERGKRLKSCRRNSKVYQKFKKNREGSRGI
jgi:hypothetical protein